MHWFVIGLTAGLLASGCVNSKNPRGATAAGSKLKPGQSAPPAAPVIAPLNSLSGRVLLVNTPLKYIVAEGAVGRLPAAEQVLNAYRDGQRVGEVRVSKPARGANFTADITQGDVRVGDTLRSD